MNESTYKLLHDAAVEAFQAGEFDQQELENRLFDLDMQFDCFPSRKTENVYRRHGFGKYRVEPHNEKRWG